jgi:predicted chitinase
MKISEQQFRQMLPNAGRRLDAHWPFINPALETAGIDTPQRIAAFLAQLAHESAEYRYMEEIADGSAYEGRADLGNIQPGDGVKFKGHGPIQITGRANHEACGQALGIDLIAEPRLICTPVYGTASACWFWNSRGLSLLADVDWFKTITRRINGGYNGLSDRRQYWDRNRALLGLAPVDLDQEAAAIEQFQREHGLAADGVVGARTLALLDGRKAA